MWPDLWPVTCTLASPLSVINNLKLRKVKLETKLPPSNHGHFLVSLKYKFIITVIITGWVLSNGWFRIKCYWSLSMFFKFGIDGWNCVIESRILLYVPNFCLWAFFFGTMFNFWEDINVCSRLPLAITHVLNCLTFSSYIAFEEYGSLTGSQGPQDLANKSASFGRLVWLFWEVYEVKLFLMLEIFVLGILL